MHRYRRMLRRLKILRSINYFKYCRSVILCCHFTSPLLGSIRSLRSKRWLSYNKSGCNNNCLGLTTTLLINLNYATFNNYKWLGLNYLNWKLNQMSTSRLMLFKLRLWLDYKSKHSNKLCMRPSFMLERLLKWLIP